MEPKLPPLHLLRIFEAAGQELSFKAAAEKLHITPSAVSHQIKNLEQHLGFALFHRSNRQLTLTKAGQDMLAAVHPHLTELRKDLNRVQRRHSQPTIRAHILPLMASQLVIPNLHTFQQAFPDIELIIETGMTPHDLEREDLDLCISLGHGQWPNLTARKLIGIEASPVCSPHFRQSHNILELSDLKGKTLIQIEWPQDPWQIWSELTEQPYIRQEHKLRLDSLYNAMTAAEKSLGVALGLFPLSYLWVEQGRLVAPFDIRIIADEAYYLLYRPEDEDRHELQLFVDWLLELFGDLDQRYRASISDTAPAPIRMN